MNGECERCRNNGLVRQPGTVASQVPQFFGLRPTKLHFQRENNSLYHSMIDQL
jgi:hypothetical protein